MLLPPFSFPPEPLLWRWRRFRPGFRWCKNLCGRCADFHHEIHKSQTSVHQFRDQLVEGTAVGQMVPVARRFAKTTSPSLICDIVATAVASCPMDVGGTEKLSIMKTVPTGFPPCDGSSAFPYSIFRCPFFLILLAYFHSIIMSSLRKTLSNSPLAMRKSHLPMSIQLPE